ncbi:glycosyltransferase [Longimicrobium sp.]|uniref:glycosyltransferase n=1 Tax=Longimicrobium sp. TaxID=2029185 RepID=UPI002C64E88A|nr:glycosyltransferase [Longimicrobium sp.]HSU15307.1 glycosyltransferase [Longimicrobium sp.]
MAGHQVFHDPSGGRRRLVARLGAGAALAVAVVTTLFVLTLLAIPVLPRVPGLDAVQQRLRPRGAPLLFGTRAQVARHHMHLARLALWREIRREERAKAAPRRPLSEPVVAGFYAPWQRTALSSLRANADRMTHLMPGWLHLGPDGAATDTTDWDPRLTPANLEVVRIARAHGLRVEPVLSNAASSAFDPARADSLLGDPDTQLRVARATRDWLLAHRFEGLNLDLENLSDEGYRQLPALVGRFARTLHAAGLTLSVDVEPAKAQVPLEAVAREADLVVAMVYGEHSPGGDPGPIASAAWAQPLLETELRRIPRDKLVLGIGNYAFDWADDGKPAAPLTYQSALQLAHAARADSAAGEPVDFDADALNPTFDYEDAGGHGHEVWMLDAVTAYNQWLLARGLGVRGAALWALGSEDPEVWTFLDRRRLAAPADPAALRRVRFPYEIEFTGQGEILSVASTPRDGSRTLAVDPQNGLVTDERYTAVPSSFVVHRSGFHAGWVALTFDDGPDGEFTGEALDTLKALRVHGSFFLVGENVERHPGLVRRMWAEGHDIGNHSFTHPNMAAIGPRRAELELNATQRGLQAIIGRSTLLFRPPYNADAEPQTAEQLDPIVAASRLGYVTVGELVDPQDWRLTMPGPDGAPVSRTAEDIAETVVGQVRGGRSNVVLLHTAGGDRSATIAALPLIVRTLRGEGYRFVTVSQLLGVPRAAVMPAVPATDETLLGLDRVTFGTWFTMANLLGTAFVLAIILGIGRGMVLTALAVAARVRERRRGAPAEFAPPVSVLIAAFNEETVIARTVASVLASRYPGFEVIVVDDGSMDGTADEVERAFGGDPRVRLFRQPNGGKAAALNRAMHESRGEIAVCFDADTEVEPDALRLLARRFADPRVGAVAGNVKVGNRVNLLTRWQSIEYVTSQNLDRRAYALLNAVTVVPGAAGAWRRAAVDAVGGYRGDTLAEDMDLTFRLRRAGWRIENEPAAIAWTEAPERMRSLFRQRFRWSFGTLQVLWKHRRGLGKDGWFGRAVMPSLWIFQVLLPILAPLVDLQMGYALLQFATAWVTRGVYSADWRPLEQSSHTLATLGFFYALFFAVELLLAFVAFRFDREKVRTLWWLFWQRFLYRQLMYAVLWRALTGALRGVAHGWNKAERRGTVVAAITGT